MSQNDLIEPVLNEEEAKMAQAASRCIMATLDHSRAEKIVLTVETGTAEKAPTLELPPQTLRLFAQVLTMMSQRKFISLIHQTHELTTQEAAAFLNVSRPYLIKLLESGKLPYRLVGRHRRVEFQKLMDYRDKMARDSEIALQELATQAQKLDMGY